MTRPSDEAFREALRGVLERSGRSMRGLSAAMGRDPGYIAALLDPSRPPRARPTPADLLAASDATGIPLVELLELLWGIPPERLASELSGSNVAGDLGGVLAGLSAAERRTVLDFAGFLADRGGRRAS